MHVTCSQAHVTCSQARQNRHTELLGWSGRGSLSSDVPFRVLTPRVKFQLCNLSSRDAGASATCPCHKRSEIDPSPEEDLWN